MFEKEKEALNLELSKKLKELGFPQDGGGWYWGIKNYQRELLFCNHSQVTLWIKYHQEELGYREIIKVPTCRELLEIKERGIIIDIWYDSSTRRFNVKCLVEKEDFDNPPYKEEFGKRLSDLLAKIRIWLAENGYVKFKRKGGELNEVR